MIDISHAMTLATSLQTAGEITKAMIGIRDGALLQAKVIELNGIILSAQGSALASNQDQFALLQSVRDLEAKVVEMENWAAEEKRYELKDFGGSTFAYVLKPEEPGSRNDHRLCSACFENRHKSTLQNMGGTHQGRQKYWCPKCKSEFKLGAFVEPPPRSSRANTNSYLKRGYWGRRGAFLGFLATADLRGLGGVLSARLMAASRTAAISFSFLSSGMESPTEDR